MEENKAHWENVYHTKKPSEVSWTQDVPQTSLDFILSCNIPKTAGIIDIGGGDSKLAGFLLDAGFTNITVLDISARALERARQRLGEKADLVKWIVQDITTFQPDASYEVWHDRATFHFLTAAKQVDRYLNIARQSINAGGYAVIGTFSTNGPEKCSGLPIKQYNEGTLTDQLSNGFKKVKCITENHVTPFNTTQHFLFCSFRRTL
ncbi:ubiquinone/menaquinone biosynthesis C-methylase UbiE [Chitinophaga sp. W3I9]|uniref:class I SAM-dependent methyltransferase n=1 Tax=Chitinophaga sp. W3I9 TaxID=3373924 RepID=UPI003D26197D